MGKGSRRHADDLKGASTLAIEATRRITDLVEAMHQTIGAGPAVLGKPLARPVRALNRVVYGSIRGVTGVVGAALTRALEALAPLLGESTPGPEREAVLAAVNGVLGDFLADTGNPLAIPMRLRRQGRPLTLEREALRAEVPEAGPALLVLVHGSCMNDLQWLRKGHDHGAALGAALGLSPVYVHYNSGLHVSANGAQLSGLLEQLVEAWPVPVTSVTLLGHSMGGLVARAACLTAEAQGHRWRARLHSLACLGTPHHGAPLERGGSLVDLLLEVSRYSAPLARLGKIRSAGVTDLRHGTVLAEHWEGRDRFAHHGPPTHQPPLPQGVRCYALAARLDAGARGRRLGDGLVPVASALGQHQDPRLALAFPEAHRWVGTGLGHVDLLDRAEVYQALVQFLQAPG
jgi:pimeloyl-ACP methyl ester carboxylesterase